MPFIRNTRAQLTISIRCLFALASLLLLSSCATTNIAGLDRIFFPNSSAKVGPLLSAEEQYPPTQEQASEDLADDSQVIEPSTDELQAQKDQEIAIATAQSKAASIASATQVEKKEPAQKIEDKPLAIIKETVQPIAKESAKSAPAPKPKETPKQISTGSINGKIELIDGNGKTLPALGTLISLTPKQLSNSQVNRSPKTHIIDMEQKEYQPRYSTINAGDQVVFVNKDKIQHNVFSSSGGNAFDLGTYGAGLKRAVTLEQPGIVKIYCNIHADMATFVSVGDQNLSTKADAQGRYRIDNLAAGSYELSIWNIRGEMKRTIEVKASDALTLTDRIDTAAFKIESHKNKFGGKYSKNASLFEDEFY